ncbi:MAG: sulfite exporter TauE/SafE family protein [Myxococcota bacterium]
MTLFLAVLGASFFGSMHCAGMCGPLVLLYSDGKQTVQSHALYHGGRLATYATLGAIAGALGGLVDLGGALIGVAQLAALFASVAIAIWGAIKLAEAFGHRVPETRAGRTLKAASLAASKRLLRLPPALRAGGLGLASALLPCGWLYAFVAVAAGTGSATFGALAMFGFWIGTVPALLAIGVGARSLLGPLRSKAPLFAAASLVLVGLATVGMRAGKLDLMTGWTTNTASAAVPPESHPGHQEHHTVPDASDAPCH